MDFLELRLFDELLLAGTSGGPSYKTTVVGKANGAEQRNAAWSRQRARYDVGGRVVDQQELEELIEIFHAVQGRALGFRWRDIADYKVKRAESHLKPLPDARSYQLFKRTGMKYGVTRERKISKPVAEGLRLWLNGVETTAFTLDATRGIVALNHVAEAEVIDAQPGNPTTLVLAQPIPDLVVGATVHPTGTYFTEINDKPYTVTAVQGVEVTINAALPSNSWVEAGGTLRVYPQAPDLEAAFEFDLPVRFDVDELLYTYEGGDLEDPGYTLPSLPVVELKL